MTTIWGSGPAAGQLTNRILRYHEKGVFDVNWDTFTVECGACPSAATQSLIFDPSGNLWVATAYGRLGRANLYFEIPRCEPHAAQSAGRTIPHHDHDVPWQSDGI